MNLSAITFFDNNFKHLSINSSIEVAKLKPEPTFAKTTNEIKYNHLKSIASTTMNLSAITLFVENIEQLIMNSSIEVSKLKPEPTFAKTTNYIKDNHLKSIASTTMNLSAITFFGENLEQLIMNSII